MEANIGTFIGLGLILFGAVLSIGKYQYERDEERGYCDL